LSLTPRVISAASESEQYCTALASGHGSSPAIRFRKAPQRGFRAQGAKGLIVAEVGAIRTRRTGELPDPIIAGSSGSSGVRVSVQNSSPHRLELLLSGPYAKRLLVPVARVRNTPQSSDFTSCLGQNNPSYDGRPLLGRRGPSAGEGEGTEHCGWLSCRSHRTQPPINQYAPPDPCFAPPVRAIRAAGKTGFFMGRSPL
jgi:hypothetical protein